MEKKRWDSREGDAGEEAEGSRDVHDCGRGGHQVKKRASTKSQKKKKELKLGQGVQHPA